MRVSMYIHIYAFAKLLQYIYIYILARYIKTNIRRKATSRCHRITPEKIWPGRGPTKWHETRR
jgi:hypothetical protein